MERLSIEVAKLDHEAAKIGTQSVDDESELATRILELLLVRDNSGNLGYEGEIDWGLMKPAIHHGE